MQPGHEVDHHVARTAGIEAVLHLLAVAAAEVARPHGRRRQRVRHAAELHGEVLRLVLDGCQVEPLVVDERMVEVEIVVFVVDDPLPGPVLGRRGNC